MEKDKVDKGDKVDKDKMDKVHKVDQVDKDKLDKVDKVIPDICHRYLHTVEILHQVCYFTHSVSFLYYLHYFAMG